jgi:glycosyltransferase involved in cell wall biosynthesis
MQRVIHIGSNVPAFSSDLPRTQNVLYFGQIRPGKGLEGFLELARHSLQLARPFKYKVIGSVPQRRVAYYKAARAESVPEVEWLIDLSFQETARLMASSLAAYLPFPDGASYRRGSLLAALTNGLPAMTTVGSATPSELLDVLLPTTGPIEALTHLDRLYGDPGEVATLSCAERLFAVNFSWEHIARQHEQLYLDTLLRTQPKRQQHQAACS